MFFSFQVVYFRTASSLPVNVKWLPLKIVARNDFRYELTRAKIETI